jgi:hypothetical protein
MPPPAILNAALVILNEVKDLLRRRFFAVAQNDEVEFHAGDQNDETRFFAGLQSAAATRDVLRSLPM